MQNMTDLNTGADKRKTGIFGGAFNPVHNGHIKLARYYFETLELDRLLFIPTADPPHKSSADFADGEDRIKMLELATEDIDGFEVCDIEFRIKGKSYTYLTLTELKKLYPNDELYLIIGADQLLNFDKWYRYRDILGMVTLCTAAREHDRQHEIMLEYAKNLDGLSENKFFLADYDVYKISSSEIRNEIKTGGDASAHLPEKVYKYIKEKGIYV